MVVKRAVDLELKLLLMIGAILTFTVFPIFTDPVNLPKFIILMSTSFSLAYFVGVLNFKELKAFLSKSWFLNLIKPPVTLSLLLFLSGVLISSLLSESPLTGIFGLSGRRNGFLTYLALFSLFLVAKKIGTKKSLFHYLRALAYVGSIQAIYMLFQFWSLDPLPWETVYENRMFGTLGNPNFSSAFLAMSLPAILFCSFSNLISSRKRIYFKVCILISLSAMFLSGVYQGPLSLALATIIILVLFVKTGAFSKIIQIGTYSAFFGLVLIFALGILKLGPLSVLFSKYSFQIRLEGYWSVATQLGLSKPFFGLGSEQFLNYFPRAFGPNYRSRFGQLTTDNAHNYLFHFFAEGGFFVLLPYISFLFFTSLMLYQFCLRASKENRVLLFTYLGIWTAFIGQMLVSIDTMGLSVWIWILVGLLLGSAKEFSDPHMNDKVIEKISGIQDKHRINVDNRRKINLALIFSIVIFTFFTQLAWLDNRVWFLENTRSQGTLGVVKEADLNSLHFRSKVWPADPQLLGRSSSLLLTYGFKERGFSLLNQAVSLNPDSPSLLNLRAAATESIVNRSLAAAMRAREVEMDPWNPVSSIELIRDLLEQKNLIAARIEFKRLQTFADKSSIELARKLIVAVGVLG